MNRTIKFRGKHLDEKIWYYGSLIVDDANNCTMVCMDFGEVPIDPATVGQFTGLLDSNGREIYERDILLRDRCVEHPCIVEFENGGFKIHDRNVYSPLSAIIQFSHIIGNIHDDLELIKTK